MRYSPCRDQFCSSFRVKESTFQGLGLLSEAIFEVIMVDIGIFCNIVVVRGTEVFGNPVAAVGVSVAGQMHE
jgi:hypothetical protein